MDVRPILLVEDNPDDVELTLRAFRKGRMANPVIVARDGVEALACLFGEGSAAALPLPQLVLIDLKLPRLSGVDVLHRLRADARTRRIPVVVLTSSREERDLAQCYDAGANSFVRKPVDFTEFVQAVSQLELYWLVLNEAPPLEPRDAAARASGTEVPP